MLFALLFLLVIQIPCPPAEEPSNPPTLVVEVVDPICLPLPGMTVAVKARHRSTKSWREVTSVDGRAAFILPRDGEYDIEVSAPGFKRGRQKAVYVGHLSERPLAARVQIRLKLAGPVVTVY